MAKHTDESLPEAEVTRRMNDALRRALSTPPTPHKPKPKRKAADPGKTPKPAASQHS